MKSCGKYDHLIRICYNAMSLPILFGGLLRRNRILSLLSCILVSIAIGLVVFHEYQVHNGLSEKVISYRKSLIETSPEFSYQTLSKVAGFIALSMSLFESNSFIMQAKFEMKQPEHFTKVTTLALMIYGLIALAFGIMSFLAFGKDMSVPIINNYSPSSLSNSAKGI
jgi:amino acid permease